MAKRVHTFSAILFHCKNAILFVPALSDDGKGPTLIEPPESPNMDSCLFHFVTWALSNIVCLSLGRGTSLSPTELFQPGLRFYSDSE